jgi:EmrB/QacA subfamily drug resistance transporter
MDGKRWWVLATVAVAQLMVVLDGTIVNIALPAAQADLGFSDASRPWVVTAYALTFGGFLLLGGRLGDRFGSRRMMVLGLAGFALASAAGGWAPTFKVLVGARVLQGVFGALLAPAALSALSTTFAGTPDRGRAFGIYGAVAGGGGAVGLVLGGALTGALSWRWCLYVNIAIAAVAIAGTLFALPRDGATSPAGRIDRLGIALVVPGLFGVVLGFARAEAAGWADPGTIGLLVAATALLVGFAVAETRSTDPLLPPSVVLDRTRGTTYLVMMLAAAGMYSVYLFLTYYLQQVLGFTPLVAGVAFLPMAISVAVASAVSSSDPLQRLGLRTLVPAGAALAVAGLLMLTTIGTDTGYATHVLPALVLAGLGLGTLFSTTMGSATVGVAPEHTGIASATVNTSQQVGGSLGVAALSTLAASGTGPDPVAATIAGFHLAYLGAAVAVALAGVIALLYPRRTRAVVPSEEEPTMTPPPPVDLPMSTTVRPSDESTSIVLEPDPARQIPHVDGGLVARHDVVYATRTRPDGSALALRLDLLRPSGRAAAPLVVYVPGGGFVVSPKEAAPATRAHVARAGFAVASVEYRTVLTGGTYADAVADVADAIRFLRSHADDLGVDPGRVGLWGESAGGYLAAMIGLTTPVDAVVDFFGGSDLARLADDHDEPTRRALRSPGNHVAAFLGEPGRDLRDVPDAVAAADPATYVDATAPPFLLFHGSDDRLVSPSQSLLLHSALRAAGAESTRYVLRGANHGDLAFLGDPDAGRVWSTTTVLDLVTGFLRERLAVLPDPAARP